MGKEGEDSWANRQSWTAQAWAETINYANSEVDPWFYNVTGGWSCSHEETWGAAEDPTLLSGCEYTLYIKVVIKVDVPYSNTNSYLSKSGHLLETIAFRLPWIYGWILVCDHLLRKRTFTLMICNLNMIIFEFQKEKEKELWPSFRFVDHLPREWTLHW